MIIIVNMCALIVYCNKQIFLFTLITIRKLVTPLLFISSHVHVNIYKKLIIINNNITYQYEHNLVLHY